MKIGKKELYGTMAVLLTAAGLRGAIEGSSKGTPLAEAAEPSGTPVVQEADPAFSNHLQGRYPGWGSIEVRRGAVPPESANASPSDHFCCDTLPWRLEPSCGPCTRCVEEQCVEVEGPFWSCCDECRSDEECQPAPNSQEEPTKVVKISGRDVFLPGTPLFPCSTDRAVCYDKDRPVAVIGEDGYWEVIGADPGEHGMRLCDRDAQNCTGEITWARDHWWDTELRPFGE